MFLPPNLGDVTYVDAALITWAESPYAADQHAARAATLASAVSSLVLWPAEQDVNARGATWQPARAAASANVSLVAALSLDDFALSGAERRYARLDFVGWGGTALDAPAYSMGAAAGALLWRPTLDGRLRSLALAVVAVRGLGPPEEAHACARLLSCGETMQPAAL